MPDPQGQGEIQINEWFALFAAAGTTEVESAKLAKAVDAALEQGAVVDALASLGLTPMKSSPAELAARLQRDLDFWGPVVAASGFTPEA